VARVRRSRAAGAVPERPPRGGLTRVRDTILLFVTPYPSPPHPPCAGTSSASPATSPSCAPPTT
jgi:hypothetical protein